MPNNIETEPKRFTGRTAIVFGAGSSGPGFGNGKASAILFARQGARVAAVDLNADAAAETASIIESEGGRCIPLSGDVTSASAINTAVEQTLAAFGNIDILHNNVGVATMGSVEDLTEMQWKRSLDINLTSVFLTCQRIIPLMLKQGRGAIVNVSSLASVQINRYPYLSYYAAKSGLNHMTRALAVQYAPHNIRVNAVLPGVMDTPLIHSQIAGQFEDTQAMMAARHAASPMGRMGDAWDVAHAAAFLASDEAKYITGVCLPVDGGKSCAGR